MHGTLMVGFDLDMTLVDSRPGIGRVWDELSASTGVYVDSDLATSRLGPPLATEVANWVPPERVDEFVARYRSLYPTYAIEATPPLPGARDALEAVRAVGGQTMVVTSKNGPHARLHVEHLSLPVDEVVGDLFSAAKAEALRAHGATVYVGDHVHDVVGAKVAGAASVGVATGPCSAEELTAAGADVVLGSLEEFPAWLESYVLDRRLADLEASLAACDGVVVAFSGGADSAFLLAAAVRALGAGRVVAATAQSDSLSSAELAPAEEFCADLGVRHLTPRTHEMERAGYRANAGDRCYFCKAELLDVLRPLADELGFAEVATGTNADDAVAGFRPGIRAASERGAITPIRDAGLTKAQVRAASRRWGLPTWDKPAAACLSSRIAYGVEVTPARLARVDRAELALRDLLSTADIAVTDLRVRDLGGQARVELDAGALGGVLDSATLADEVVAVVRQSGFGDVVIDPMGFRSGSMNELLAEPDRYR